MASSRQQAQLFDFEDVMGIAYRIYVGFMGEPGRIYVGNPRSSRRYLWRQGAEERGRAWVIMLPGDFARCRARSHAIPAPMKIRASPVPTICHGNPFAADVTAAVCAGIGAALELFVSRMADGKGLDCCGTGAGELTDFAATAGIAWDVIFLSSFRTGGFSFGCAIFASSRGVESVGVFVTAAFGSRKIGFGSSRPDVLRSGCFSG